MSLSADGDNSTTTLSSTTSDSSNVDKTLIVIGGGYSGLSFIQSIREIEKQQQHTGQRFKIILITMEDFCSRPNLFFRFKFLQWHSKHLDYYGGIHLNKNSSSSNTNTTTATTTDDSHASSFATKYDVDQVLFNTCVFDIDSVEQIVKYKTTPAGVNDGGAGGEETVGALHYDTLCLCIGGKAHIVNYPTIIDESCTDNQKQLVPVLNREEMELLGGANFGEIHSHISNYLFIRNIEQVEYIHRVMKRLYEYHHDGIGGSSSSSGGGGNRNNRIVIIGSGTLAIDIVSHILEGYESIEKALLLSNSGESAETTTTTGVVGKKQTTTIEEIWKIKNTELLPKITIIGRGKHLGKSLLRDEVACDMILRLAREKYGKYLDIQLETQVESILYSDNLAHGVKTNRNGGDNDNIIPCSLIIQAVGVKSETELASKCLGASIGVNGGILVDEHFQIITSSTSTTTDDSSSSSSSDITIPNIYCIGDCTEFRTGVDRNRTTNSWKNWTSAREQASACANYMLSTGRESKLFFSQTPKFFGLYITCLGEYESVLTNEGNSGENSNLLQIITIDEHVQKNIYLKFIFKSHGSSSNEQCQLIGALIIGPNMNEYKLGLNFLQLLKEHVYLPKAIISSTQLLSLNFNVNYWSKLMSLVKARKSSTDIPFETTEQVEKLISELTVASEKKATPAVNPLLAKKKFVNPLEKKKQAAATASTTTTNTTTSEEPKQ